MRRWRILYRLLRLEGNSVLRAAIKVTFFSDGGVILSPKYWKKQPPPPPYAKKGIRLDG